MVIQTQLELVSLNKAVKKTKECVPHWLTKIKANSLFLLPEEFAMGSGMDISSILYQKFH